MPDFMLFNLDAFSPVADCMKIDDQFKIVIEVPGLVREDITIQCLRNKTILKGKKTRERDLKTALTQRRFGDFTVSYRIPEEYEIRPVGVTLENGLLTLTYAKSDVNIRVIIS
jgi:HSP20 family molecular chaperone IbpA